MILRTCLKEMSLSITSVGNIELNISGHFSLFSEGFDHYGTRSFREDTPEEFRFKWKLTPLNVNDDSLQIYNSHTTDDFQPISIHALLNAAENMIALECVRVSVMETLIGNIRASSGIMNIVHEIASGQLNNFQQRFCAGLVALAGTVIRVSVSSTLAILFLLS